MDFIIKIENIPINISLIETTKSEKVKKKLMNAKRKTEANIIKIKKKYKKKDS
jgi:hypothetical protein